MGGPSVPKAPAAPPPPPDLTDQAIRAQAMALRKKLSAGGGVRQSFLTGPSIKAAPSVLAGPATGAKSLLGA